MSSARKIRLPGVAMGFLRSAALRLALCVTLLGAFLGACSRAETPKVTQVVVMLRLASDTAALPLMRALTNAYTDEHPNINFTLQSGNAQAVAGMVFDQQVDMAAVSLLPPDVPGRDKPWVADLAADGVAIIVNPANPIEMLSTQELRDIFTGARNRWSDFGTVGLGDIQVGVREEGDGTRATFDQVVMDNAHLTLSAVVLPTEEVAMNFVSLEANAIAYVPTARITSTITPLVRVVNIDGQAPTPANISSGTYRLNRMLNLIALSEPHDELRQFVAWALGDEGQRVVGELNYVKVSQAPH